MYQRTKIPEILIDRSWHKKEITKLSQELNTSEADIKYILDQHFTGVSNALWSDKTNIEVTDLIRFQIKPKPIQSQLQEYQQKKEKLKTHYKNNPEKLHKSLTTTQAKIDHLQIKLTNFKNLGNEF